MKTHTLRNEGRAVEALLILLKNLTAHARWVFVILLLLYAVSGIRTIQPQEQALLLRFGSLQPKVHGPGLLIGLPEPFDRVLRFETGKDISLPLDAWTVTGAKIGDPDKPVELSDAQLADAVKNGTNGGAAQSTYLATPGAALDAVEDGYTVTGDFNIVQGRFIMRYRIVDPFRFASSGDRIDELLARLAYRAISHELSVSKIDAALTTDRQSIAISASRMIEEEVTRLGLGLRVSGLDVRELSPPSQVIAAFEDVTNARQFAKTLYENSRQYTDETLSKTDGEARSIVHRAGGYSAGLVAEAAGEASSFRSMLTEYHRDPLLISRRLLRETLDTVMANVQSRTLIPSGQSAPSLIIEPIPEFSR